MWLAIILFQWFIVIKLIKLHLDLVILLLIFVPENKT